MIVRDFDFTALFAEGVNSGCIDNRTKSAAKSKACASTAEIVTNAD